MKFNVRLEFTGLCTLVPHEDMDKACIVMVNANPGNQSAQTVNPLVKTNYPPPEWTAKYENEKTPVQPRSCGTKKDKLMIHRSFIRYPLANAFHEVQHNSNIHPQSEGVWYLNRQRIIYEAGSKPKKLSFSSFKWKKVPLMNKVIPGNIGGDPSKPALATIDPEALRTQGPPPTKVGSQFFLNSGKLKVDSPEAKFILKPKYPHHTYPYKEFKPTQKIYVNYKSIEHFTLKSQDMDTGKSYELFLNPRKNQENIKLTVANFCVQNPLEWNTKLLESRVDIDFAWYYELLTDEAREHIRKTLEGTSIGLPLPHQKEGQGLAGGDNCNPNQHQPTTFTIPQFNSGQ